MVNFTTAVYVVLAAITISLTIRLLLWVLEDQKSIFFLAFAAMMAILCMLCVYQILMDFQGA